MTKQNIRQLALEISKARKKKRNLVKWKGKHILILLEESNDEDELHAIAADILEDAAKNKASVKQQFKIFMEEEEKKSKAKKVRVATPPEVDLVDLTTTPPPPSPTQIVQEEVPSLTSIPPIIPYM